MDFKTLSENGYLYSQESGIVIIKGFKPFLRNRTLKQSAAHPFYKVFISAWTNYLYPVGDTAKKIGGVKMSSSMWCPAIRAGKSGHAIPLSRCGGSRPRIPS